MVTYLYLIKRNASAMKPLRTVVTYYMSSTIPLHHLWYWYLPSSQTVFTGVIDSKVILSKEFEILEINRFPVYSKTKTRYYILHGLGTALRCSWNEKVVTLSLTSDLRRFTEVHQGNSDSVLTLSLKLNLKPFPMIWNLNNTIFLGLF